ncbi:protein of unknown function DUF115 [Pyrolobus fumarii 1A]|uniref:6-hydroxymethyl-7,8-dihydropterin pyrophosphokinase n=1 Tax=Pyrolobus fumarii (strain DSM 11204 / 1A) TaxID=694429 RepID=G0EEN9_PYRF1|nr:protein of unknown function DUF115 [Pyrolobus fumarii 1A]
MLLETLLYEAMSEERLASIRDIKAIVEGRLVSVVASGACLEKEANLIEGVIIAADGATSVLLHMGFDCPDIIVTDLDGPLEDILWCAYRGSLIVVHAHGDNAWLLHEIVPRTPLVAGSVQVEPLLGLAMLLPGFTDGDRAAWLAHVAGASKIRLVGWCPDAPQHPLSKRLVNPLKRRKLVIAEKLLEMLKGYRGEL